MPESRTQRKTPLVLIVDDERLMRTMLRDTLEAAGFGVVEASNGREAMERARQIHPDLIVLDVIMPDMDGFEVCSQLRKINEIRHLPILMVTASEEREVAERAYAAGATDFIPKPINAAHLRHHVRYMLRASLNVEELRQKEQRLAHAQRLARLGNWEWERGEDRLRLSEEARRILAVADDAVSLTLAAYLEHIHPREREAIRRGLDQLWQNGPPLDLDFRLLRPDGTERFVHGQADRIVDAGGDAVRLVGTIQDISERKRIEEKLTLAGKVFHSSGDMILITDMQGWVVDVNDTFCRLTGFRREKIVGWPLGDLLSGQHDSEFYRHIWQTVTDKGFWQGEVWSRRQDGESFPALVSVNAARSDGEENGHYVFSATDLSRLRETERQLHYLSHFDPLTDLPNRLLFLDRLQQSLVGENSHQGQVAVLFIDLDDFKEINDTLGSQTGDRVLQEVARKIKECIRASDTVARPGSDEFAVILREVVPGGDAASVAQKLVDSLSTPFAFVGREFYVTLSIGIALSDIDGTDPEELIQKAETAMVCAKEQGKNRYIFFSEAMNQQVQERLAMKTSLRRSLERDQFLLHYQPKFNSVTREFTGLEALARWQHPDRGLIAPAHFITLAEETGLIVPLGEMTLRKACRQNRQWQERGYHPFPVAVNLSAQQFGEQDLVDTVCRALRDTGLSPQCLELEITESVILQDTERAIDILRKLKNMGIRIALDDFGTGFSSLDYLRRFPLDVLKIDHTFVRGVVSSEQDAAIVRAIIAMAHSMRLKVVAEGVETEEQRVFLREQGCDEVQGYLVALPVPPEEVERFFPLAGGRRDC
ncbi:EAL domain-containing protein [Desulfuromonas sp. AOP6]|uniref:two-component system response regulator n=1 Tax=Desulfuromonas sp. AOP6 TaxID=1566351 RepID=UPI00127903D2|nr:EAL domain-containing protein [Desulfuromonas sp. AOP6]BCA80706.1 hypothetical protein AOP6_2493 [Desulfuromonas sp. AOP6]